MSDKNDVAARLPAAPPEPETDVQVLAVDRTALRRPFWIVDGVAYDFREWIEQHPGGAAWFLESMGRDISALFHSYHQHPERLRKMLEKYRIDDGLERHVIPNMGVPPFLLPPGFNAATDLPRFDFGAKDGLRGAVMRRLHEEVPRKDIQWHDRVFDALTGWIFAVHVLVMCALVLGALPALACVPLLVLTRTSLAGAGHFHLHRKKPTGKPRAIGLGHLPCGLFDFNYIGTYLVGVDGHVILHHPHLASGGDIKEAFLAGMRRLHPLLRFWGYTIHKLGMCLFASAQLGANIIFGKTLKVGIRLEFWLVRAWLLLEFIVCLATGHAGAWLVQFVLTLWFNTLLVTASHELQNAHEGHDGRQLEKLPEHLRNDWAARQVGLSYDLTVVGNRWVDVFLSAGLSTHRVHHVLPFQGSGFANLASEAAVRKACEEAGLSWERPRSLFKERLPAFVKHYLLSPATAADPGGRGDRPALLRELGAMSHYILNGWQTGAD